ncbi:MAG: OmpA family protein [Bacteroidota bacterium]
MSKKTVYLLGILLTILIGTFFYWKLCCGGGLVAESDSHSNRDSEEVVDTPSQGDSDARTSTTKTTGFPFTLSDPSGDFSFSSNDSFNFDASGFDLLRPISEKVNTGIDELQLYLSGNDGKSVDITGLYTSREENTSAFPNLGLARANAIKNYFISKGIPSTRMNLFGALNDELSADGKVYRGPVSFSFSTATEISSEEKEKAAIKALRKKIQEDPLILYFANAETTINLSESQRQKIKDIATYLDKSAPLGMVVINGHTDNTGSYAGNINISRKRAYFARSYLVQNGIPENRIKATGSGSNKPIASNETEEGRAKNRRTVVTVN